MILPFAPTPHCIHVKETQRARNGCEKCVTALSDGSLGKSCSCKEPQGSNVLFLTPQIPREQLSSCLSRWGCGRALHLKCSVAGTRGKKEKKKRVPTCSNIAWSGRKNTQRSMRLGYFTENKLLNRTFRTTSEHSSERGRKCFPSGMSVCPTSFLTIHKLSSETCSKL